MRDGGPTFARIDAPVGVRGENASAPERFLRPFHQTPQEPWRFRGFSHGDRFCLGPLLGFAVALFGGEPFFQAEARLRRALRAS